MTLFFLNYFIKNPQTRNAQAFLPLNISVVGSVYCKQASAQSAAYLFFKKTFLQLLFSPFCSVDDVLGQSLDEVIRQGLLDPLVPYLTSTASAATSSGGGKKEVLNLRASMASGSKHKYLSQRSSTAASSSASAAASKQPPQPHDNQSQISSSREGSFRFLEHEEIENTPTPKRPHKEDDDANSIQWSTNSDRLI